MTQRDRVLSMLGLAAKAGKIESGEFSTEKAVKKGFGHLVIVAEDASDNTKKMFRNMCEYYKVPMVIFGTKEELSAFLKWDSEIQKKLKSSSAYIRANLSGGNTIPLAPPVLRSGHLVNGRFVTDPVPPRSSGVSVSGR